MPYTRQELQNLEFYNDFVNGLRNRYLERIKDYADRQYPFRDVDFMRGGILYLFEDIITGMGIEDATLGEDTIYKTYLTPETLEHSTSKQFKKFPT